MKLPKVYVGIPTGDNKEYSLLYMLATLRNIDYPSDRISLTVAVTHLGNAASEAFLLRVQALIENSNFPYPVHVVTTYPVMTDMNRWGPYFAIIMNMHKMRVDFLKGDAEYFWLLGGDNPPPRPTLKRLVRMRVDVASALVLQRPVRIKQLHLDSAKKYPVYWGRAWELEDLEELDLSPELREELRTAWTEFMFLAQIQGEGVTHNVVVGSGCSLLKRRVFEHLGYVLGSGGTQSEDLHFCQLAKLLEFDIAVDMDTRCMHFDRNGKMY